MTKGIRFPCLHQDIGLRHFSPPFYGFLHPRPVHLDPRCDSCLSLLGRSRTQGPMHSEVRITCRSSRHLIRKTTSFPRPIHTSFFFSGKFSILYSRFPRQMFTHTTSFWGAYSICMDHTSVFCVCPPPHPFPHAFPFCVFLFSLLCSPLCAICLEGY
jgi:hypothetical protein